ncbi:uncharacterized protein LTR77_008155 [Saxophila tyrrhenica]|uniref:Heterokaryon incompatibility domain-containing protein n=1 Tax=Saxophila tyrrhenica TaxID=1690608 RepID=A0AAV9P2S3_9PEZI|nr:hypothetical protein LTR77_008155 [Saxophila tyrrhenica]
MRLINLYTYEFRSFYGSEIPQYAILSHCWSAHEISYDKFWRQKASFVEFCQHVRRLTGSRAVHSSTGCEKIVGFCQYARSRPARAWNESEMDTRETWLEWGWVDTCCIDVRSSAELSEAIQSMYPFYEYAAVCYAYIADVPAGAKADTDSFFNSRWFRRGWTLQELLAPWDVIFCNEQWELMGHKCTHGPAIHDACDLPSHLKLQFGDSIKKHIQNASGIDVKYLLSPHAPLAASVACRMSWAAQRETKRVEDQAYSLLGVFDINMPMLYGEGRKAFLRLQHHILQTSNDSSIFAWNRDSVPGQSMVASSPQDFSGCRDVYRVENGRATFDLTKNGLEFRGTVIKRNRSFYVIRLDCVSPGGTLIEVAIPNAMTMNDAQFQRLSYGSYLNKAAGEKHSNTQQEPDQADFLCLRASEPMPGPQILRQLCHELDVAFLSNSLQGLSQTVAQNFLRDVDVDDLKKHPVWKHIGWVYDAVAGRALDHGQREGATDVEESNAESWHGILDKARRLASAAKRHSTLPRPIHQPPVLNNGSLMPRLPNLTGDIPSHDIKQKQLALLSKKSRSDTDILSNLRGSRMRHINPNTDGQLSWR